jgi:hypothetical protein
MDRRRYPRECAISDWLESVLILGATRQDSSMRQKLHKRSTFDGSGHSLPATDSGPSPGDFPLGSFQSRAAARALADRRKKSPSVKQVRVETASN